MKKQCLPVVARAAPLPLPCPELPLHAALSPLGDQGHSKTVVLATRRSQTHREGVHETSKALPSTSLVDKVPYWMVLVSVTCSISQAEKPWEKAAFPSFPAEQPHTAAIATAEVPAMAVPSQISDEQLQHSVQETSSRSIFPLQRVTKGESFSKQRFKASQHKHIRPESPPHFSSCSPRLHTTKTAKDSQPLQRAGEMENFHSRATARTK